MFPGPYGYGFGPPPMWGYPPPNVTPMPPDIEARATKIALKLMAKEAKKKAKAEEDKEKKKADDKKKVEESKKRNLLFIEWYILGLLSYTFVGPLYRIAVNHLDVLSHAVPK